jgi:protoheme IX farnesyltransferase
MLPVVAGEDETRRQILIYSIVVAIAGLMPVFFGFAGLGYGAIAALLGVLFVTLAIEVWRKRRGIAAQSAARRLFAFSVLYLFLLFAALLVEGMR